MAFGVDTTSHATAIGSGAHSITGTHTCGAGANKIVISAAAGASVLSDRTVATVTYNGVACTLIPGGPAGAVADDGAFERVEKWRLNNPPTGSPFNYVITYVGSPNQLGAGAISYNDAAPAEGTPSANNAVSTNPNVTVVDSASGDIVESICATDGSASATTEAGTLIWEDEDVGADSDFNCQRQVAVGPNTVCSWTNATSAGWAAVGVAIKPLAALPPPPPVPNESEWHPMEPQTNPLIVSQW